MSVGIIQDTRRKYVSYGYQESRKLGLGSWPGEGQEWRRAEEQSNARRTEVEAAGEATMKPEDMKPEDKGHDRRAAGTPARKLPSTKTAEQAEEAGGPKGKGQMNEGGPAWSGDPKVGPGPTGKDAERLL